MSILSKIRAFFAREAASVDSIIADIIERVDHLQALREAKELEAKAHFAAAQESQRLAELAQQEKDRAFRIATKLIDLAR